MQKQTLIAWLLLCGLAHAETTEETVARKEAARTKAIERAKKIKAAGATAAPTVVGAATTTSSGKPLRAPKAITPGGVIAAGKTGGTSFTPAQMAKAEATANAAVKAANNPPTNSGTKGCKVGLGGTVKK